MAVAKTILPSALQVAFPPEICRFGGVTAMSEGSPPETGIFSMRRPREKPIHWPSGDQKGLLAPSVPRIGRASISEKARSHNRS